MIETTSTTAGRANDGRFTADNPGGPGNPFARRVAALRVALLETATAADVQEIFAALIERAKKGEPAAARLVLGYLVGKPSAQPEPDRLDAEEWDLLKRESRALAEMPAVAKQTSAAVPLDLVRLSRYAVDVKARMELAEGFQMLDAGAPTPSPNGKSSRPAPHHGKPARPGPQTITEPAEIEIAPLCT